MVNGHSNRVKQRLYTETDLFSWSFQTVVKIIFDILSTVGTCISVFPEWHNQVNIYLAELRSCVSIRNTKEWRMWELHKWWRSGPRTGSGSKSRKLPSQARRCSGTQLPKCNQWNWTENAAMVSQQVAYQKYFWLNMRA